MFPDVIQTALHRKGVRTPDEYFALQRRIIATNRAARPALPWQEPWRSVERPPVYIGASTWLVRCRCGDCAVVDPDHALACCCYCGAIYEHLELPADRAEIEAVLLKRANPAHRNWRPAGLKGPLDPGETVEDLRRENLDHGEPV